MQDKNNTVYWAGIFATGGEAAVKKESMKYLRQLFPNVTIPEPTKIYYRYRSYAFPDIADDAGNKGLFKDEYYVKCYYK